MTGPTFVDLFCGAGGSSSGLRDAGLTLKLAANHWARAIETHAANFPDADHACVDLDHYDMRRLPGADVLWASPICTEISPAGGRRRRTTAGRGQIEAFGPVAIEAFSRTRATFWDVIRAVEVWRHRVVIIENVVEAAEWELFDVWLQAMTALGYHYQLISVSSAHVGGEGNPHAPQWRDRMYVFFTRRDLTPPTIEPRPAAWCPECGEVDAVQWWKKQPVRRVGKYGAQYLYRCPTVACHKIVEPYVRPAAAAIDWADLGSRIGDRPKPLAPATMRRIKAGLDMFAQPVTATAAGNTFERPGYFRAWPADDSPLTARTGTAGDGVAVPPYMVSVNHDGDGRQYPVHERPLPTRSTKIGDAVVTPPFLVDRYDYSGSDAGRLHGMDEPLKTVTTRSGTVHTMVTPKPFVTMLRAHADATGIGAPLDTVATARHHALTVPAGAFVQKHHGGLVIPYRRGAKPHRSDDRPLSTIATREGHGLLSTDVEVEDCHFRMLKPREHLRAQRFYDDYVVFGNLGEQTMQAGNSVSSNVAQWLGSIACDVLEGVAS